MSGALRQRRGQTPTEYLMIAGLLTAMLIVLSGIIIPTLRDVTLRLAAHIIVNLSSPASAAEELQPCPKYVELDPDQEEDLECVEQ